MYQTINKIRSSKDGDSSEGFVEEEGPQAESWRVERTFTDSEEGWRSPQQRTSTRRGLSVGKGSILGSRESVITKGRKLGES